MMPHKLLEYTATLKVNPHIKIKKQVRSAHYYHTTKIKDIWDRIIYYPRYVLWELEIAINEMYLTEDIFIIFRYTSRDWRTRE